MAMTMKIKQQIEMHLQKRRLEKQAEQKKRREEIQKIIPEYFVLEKEYNLLGIEMARNTLKKENTEAEKNGQRCEMKKIKEKMALLLEQYNYPTDYLERKPFCPICQDKGKIDGKDCQCINRIKQKLIFEASSLEQRLEKDNFENFNLDIFSTEKIADISPRHMMKKLKKIMEDYANNFNPHSPSIFFSGDVGVGKTFLCSCIARRVMEKGHTVLYRSASALMKESQDYYYTPFEDKEAYEQRYQYLMNVDLLIIDDLGTELLNERHTSFLFNVINERSTTEKPTIISSNLKLNELREEYGDRIYSRISGLYKNYYIVGCDLRKENSRVLSDSNH